MVECHGKHCPHVDELISIKQWFFYSIRIVGFTGPFVGALVAVIALVYG